MEYHIGKLIKAVREQRNISQEQLVAGISNRKALSQMEKGDREPNKWMADVLLERLGVSPNKFGCIFTKKEWEEERKREQLLLLLRENKKKEVLELCEKYRERNQDREPEPYLDQFLSYVCLVASMEENGFLNDGKENVLRVLQMTVPEFEIEHLEKSLLGRLEWALTVLLADVLCRTEETREQGLSLYHRILLQLPEKMIDTDELKRSYPYVVALFVEQLSEYGRSSDLWICRKGLESLKRSRSLHAMYVLMKYEEASKCEFSDMLISLNKDEDSKMYFFAKLAEGSFRGISKGENLKQIRKSKGLKQSEVVADAGSIRNLSRIENGRSDMTSYTYQRILEAMDQTEYRYFPHVMSDDYQMHKCRSRIASFIARRKYEEAEFELLQLEQGLDRTERLNQQIIMRFDAVVKGERGIISREEELQMLYEALYMTVPPEVNLAEWPLMRNEIVLLNSIANVLEAIKKQQEASEILRQVVQAYEKQPDKTGRDTGAYLISVYNLSRFVGNEGCYEEALKLSESGLRTALEENNGYYTMSFLYKKAWNMEKIYEKDGKDKEAIESCLPLYRQAKLLAEFYDDKTFQKLLQTQIEVLLKNAFRIF